MKNQGKSDKVFSIFSILPGMGDKLGGKFAFLLSRTCACAPSNNDIDFLLSQVSQMGKIIPRNSGKCWQEIEVFWDVLVGVEVDYSLCLLKYVQVICSSLRYSILWLGCDTCDSKKAKTPVMRAYACAREGVIIGIFTLRKTLFLMDGSLIVFSLRTFTENKPLFFIKRHVVFIKRTRCFS